MFKIILNSCCGLDVHKTWIYACVGITDNHNRTQYYEARFQAFSKGLRDLAAWLAKYNCTQVCMESSGKYWIPVFNILEKTCKVTLAHPKYTKPMKGNKTDRKDARWICDLFMCGMVKPSFIPPPVIRQLRDLVRYRVKLTNMITGEKNRAQNCLTVSNLKLDDVFSDVFGKSARSITEYILAHPGETFDVAPFVDRRCKTPISEIQAAVDGAVSHEQAVKLRQCLDHIDELEKHRSEIEVEINRLVSPFTTTLDLIHTVPGFDKNPLTAITVVSEIGVDMSVFPSSKNLVSWAGCCPRNVANAVIKSKDHPEFGLRYRRIKAHRGHKKAIIAICRMLLTAIWNVLSKREPYSPDGYSVPQPSFVSKPLTKSQGLALLRQMGYVIKDDNPPPVTA